MKIIPRFASREILDASSEFPAVLVTGARQVGKTTLLRETAEAGRRFVSLDALPVRDLARRDPDAFLKAYPAPVIIDEIQYAPQLLPHIKAIIDENPNLCGRFWLSGSQQFHLMKNVSESLAGRIAIINLGGIAQREERGVPMPDLSARRMFRLARRAMESWTYTSAFIEVHSRRWCLDESKTARGFTIHTCAHTLNATYTIWPGFRTKTVFSRFYGRRRQEPGNCSTFPNSPAT